MGIPVLFFGEAAPDRCPDPSFFSSCVLATPWVYYSSVAITSSASLLHLRGSSVNALSAMNHSAPPLHSYFALDNRERYEQSSAAWQTNTGSTVFTMNPSWTVLKATDAMNKQPHSTLPKSWAPNVNCFAIEGSTGGAGYAELNSPAASSSTAASLSSITPATNPAHTRLDSRAFLLDESAYMSLTASQKSHQSLQQFLQVLPQCLSTHQHN